MFKKISCFLLVLLLLPGLYVKAEPGEGTVLFEADFRNGELPRGTDVTFGDDGSIYAEDGVMVVEASDTYPPVTTALFPYAPDTDTFFFECDIKLESHLSANSWFALCFGAGSEDHLIQLTVDCTGAVSMLEKRGASSWTELSAAAHTDPGKLVSGELADDSEFRLAVAVTGGAAYGYVDGELVCECRAVNGAKGYVGVNGRGVTFTVDNVRVTMTVPKSAGGGGSFRSELYTVATAASSVPLIIERDRSGRRVYTADDRRPGAVMMTVKAAGNELRCYDGTTDLGPLGERISGLGGLALPALYVTDQQSAELLSAYCRENGIDDAFVIFSRSSFAAQFAENGYIRRVMDLSSRDSIDVAETYRMLYSNGLRTVMLSSSAADPDTVYELHKRFISVWVVAQAGALPAFDAAVCGADAVVTPDPEAVIEAFEGITDRSVIRRQVVICDGGDTAAAPANTLKSILSAADSGARAIAVTVRLTKDGVPVLSGGDRVSGMSSDPLIRESAYASLQTLTYTDSRMSRDDRITSLEELFETFSREHTDVVFDINVADEAAVSAVHGIARSYDMTERCVILSDSAAALKAANEAGAAAVYTGLRNVFDGRDADASLHSLCRTLTSFNSVCTLLPPERFPRMLSMHGIGVYPAADDGESAMFSGYDGYMTSDFRSAAKLPSSLDASVDADGRISAMLVYCDGTKLDVTALCTAAVSSGDVTVSGGAATGSGSFAVICPQTAENGEKYYICSRLLSISEEPGQPETDGPEDPGSDGTLTALIVAGAAVVIAGGLVLLGVLSRKKRKESA